MAMTPREEAAYALDFGVSRSDLSPEAQAEYDRLAGERQEDRRERERLVAATAWFPDLGVGVRDGNVYQHTAEMKLLGPLAGAHAEAVAGNAGRRRSAGERAVTVALVGPVGAVSRAYRGVAVVVFADGSSSERMLTDLASVARAQAQATQFNTLLLPCSPRLAQLPGKALPPLRTVRGLPPSWSAWPRCTLQASWTMRSSGQRRRALSAAESLGQVSAVYSS